MPKERSKETSPEYGSFIVSILKNSIGLMFTDGKNGEYAKGMEWALISLEGIDEIRDELTTIFHKIKPASVKEWRRFIADKFIPEFLLILAQVSVKQGNPDPLVQIPKRKYVDQFLDLLGWEWSFSYFVRSVREKILTLSDLILFGNREDVIELFRDAASGITENPGEAVSLIRFTLVVAGGDELVQAIDDAVEILHSRLLSSPEFSAAVELVEKREKQDGSFSDIKFREALD